MSAAHFDHRLVNLDFAQQPEVAEHFPRAEHDGSERIVGDGNGETGLFANTFVEILDKSAAAGEDDTAVGDVPAESSGGVRSRATRMAFMMTAMAFAEGLANSRCRRWRWS